MREDFLHYLWRFKRFDTSELKTTDGDSIEIIDFGEYNRNAGPDFLNARIKINDILWAGNIEMHINASDWLTHKHDNDESYQNVILHVVFEEDKVIYDNSTRNRLACLELKPHIKENLLGKYHQLLHNSHWIPCQHHFYSVSDVVKDSWYTRLLMERLEEKITSIEMLLVKNKWHWEETFYQVIAKNFGLKVNDLPFELLAQSLSLLTLSKHKDNAIQIEALLFGQAGFLDKDFVDEYPNKLKKEYKYLSNKHQLTAINNSIWKFSRLRPSNFPTIRIAQFSTLIFQSVHLFSKIIEAKTVKDIHQLFEVKLSDYWLEHYVFDKKSKKIDKTLGNATIELLIINTVVPFIFLYGKINSDESLKEKAVNFLEEIAPEKNTIIDSWQNLGVKPKSAATTQALLQLKNKYCKSNHCLHCSIGINIMKKAE